MFTAPTPAGLTAVICVAESTTKLAAAVPPNCTAVAPVKALPVMTTAVPPASGPKVGTKPEMLGAGRYPKVPAEVPVPFGVVMLTVTAPTPAGDVAVIWVAESTVKLEAFVLPNCTTVAPVQPVPVMTTVVPPTSGPDAGTKPEIVGGGR